MRRHFLFLIAFLSYTSASFSMLYGVLCDSSEQPMFVIADYNDGNVFLEIVSTVDFKPHSFSAYGHCFGNLLMTSVELGGTNYTVWNWEPTKVKLKQQPMYENRVQYRDRLYVQRIYLKAIFRSLLEHGLIQRDSELYQQILLNHVVVLLQLQSYSRGKYETDIRHGMLRLDLLKKWDKLMLYASRYASVPDQIGSYQKCPDAIDAPFFTEEEPQEINNGILAAMFSFFRWMRHVGALLPTH